jgi:hypothetical protein
MIDPGCEVDLRWLEGVVSWEVDVQEEQLHNQDLSSKHQLQWSHLFGHSEVSVVSGLNSVKGSAVHLLAAV